ncbi:MAG: glycosyltransferase family 2 protein [Spirochaetota bacterium]
MLLTMIVALSVTAFAGTVLLHPAFHADLRTFVRRRGEAATEERALEAIRRTSVVIPARNEASTIPSLLRSLRAQTVAPLEIIVVDDQSEDETAAVARAEGARVVEAGPRPDGWLGKPWASRVGACEASGRYLLFLDADVTLHSDAVEQLATAMIGLSDGETHTATLSVQPYHRTGRLRERLALLFNIQVFVGASRRTRGLLLTMRGSCCFGPCIYCGREEYERFHGHEAVRDCVLDDLELGVAFHDADVPTRSFCGRGVIDYRMYPGGVRDLLDGFTKNILLGARRSGGWLKVLAVLWVTGLLAATVWIALGLASEALAVSVIATVFYLFFASQIAAAGHRLGNFGPLAALLYPVHLAAFLFVFARAIVLAATGRSVRWKGRALHPDTR